jgi:hypothetical protein
MGSFEINGNESPLFDEILPHAEKYTWVSCGFRRRSVLGIVLIQKKLKRQ